MREFIESKRRNRAVKKILVPEPNFTRDPRPLRFFPARNLKFCKDIERKLSLLPLAKG
jgi:hypothetical protein